MELNQLTQEIIGAAIEVHRTLGPGLLESTYETVTYKDIHVDCGYRIDLLVEHQVVVELKAVAQLEKVHEAQLLTYLRLSGHQIGLLINFNVRHLKAGLRRLVNNLLE